MKISYLFILLALVIGLSSCDPDYSVDQYFDLEELPGYVAFDADGNNAVRDDVETAEDGGTASLVIENPTGTLTDISVSYSLSGSAVYGTDYTIDGATSSGGSLTIPADGGAVNQTIRASLVINLLTDSVADGEKIVTVTLTEASNAEGSLAVGRGGTEFLKSANVIIADID